ncbi:hypothetical protein CIP107518_01128 [Corynebacterium diphtheriae]|nr:hypothetical protein CIP107518_01128 [Corynebacterium diphtheriae]
MATAMRVDYFPGDDLRSHRRRPRGGHGLAKPPVRRIEFYPVVFLDALRIKVRDGGRVINKSAYMAMGVDLDGI